MLHHYKVAWISTERGDQELTYANRDGRLILDPLPPHGLVLVMEGLDDLGRPAKATMRIDSGDLAGLGHHLLGVALAQGGNDEAVQGGPLAVRP